MWNPNSDNKTEDVSIAEITKQQLNIVDKALAKAAGNIAAGNGNTPTTTIGTAKNLEGESSSSIYGGGGVIESDCAYSSTISCGGEVDSGFLSGPQLVEDYDNDLKGGRAGKPTISSAQLNIVPYKEQEIADDYLDSGCIEDVELYQSQQLQQKPSITTTAATPQIQQRELLDADEDQMILDSGIDADVTESLCNLSLDPGQKLNNLDVAGKNKSEGNKSSSNNRNTTDTSAWEIYYQQNNEGDTQLHLACLTGYVDVVAALIRMAPHPCLFNIQNDEAQTGLHLAVLYGQPKILRMLLIAGAEPTVRDRNGNTPLHLACMSGDIQCVKAITIPISASEINEAHRSYGHLSSDRTTSYLDCAHLPADLEVRNYDGERCVHLAAQGGHIDILRHLVWFGADINAREGKSGRTPLHIAIECCNEILANFLLEECSTINLETATYAGLTAYQVACVLNNSTMQNNLENRGAEPLTPPDSDYESSDIETDLDDSQLYDRFGDPRYFANYNGGNPINVA